MMQERDDSEQLVRELMRKTKKLQEEQAAAEQSLRVSPLTVLVELCTGPMRTPQIMGHTCTHAQKQHHGVM